MFRISFSHVISWSHNCLHEKNESSPLASVYIVMETVGVGGEAQKRGIDVYDSKEWFGER